LRLQIRPAFKAAAIPAMIPRGAQDTTSRDEMKIFLY
jgi:hypothetical protein